MTVTPNTPDLAALYLQLKSSMEDVDAMIDGVDARLKQASEEWTSKAAHEFSDAWHNGFKPSLTKLCQALAAAGTDVAFQHDNLAEEVDEAEEGDGPAHLEPLSSPR
jgi:uncharacterized protein YukE